MHDGTAGTRRPQFTERKHLRERGPRACPQRSATPGRRDRAYWRGLLPPSLHVAPEGPLDLPARVALGEVLPLVVGLLALGEGEGRLDLAVLEVEVERHEGQAALLGLADELVDLGPVHEH